MDDEDDYFLKSDAKKDRLAFLLNITIVSNGNLEKLRQDIFSDSREI